MNFELTEERQMLQDSLRRYLRDKYSTATRNEILESADGMSTEVWTQLAELGVIGAMFTEDQGGFGGAGFDIAVVFEELGRAGVVEPFMDSALIGGRILAACDKSDLVEKMIGGGLQLAVAHGEPTSRYDMSHVRTSVDGGKLNGRKAVVMNAENADHLIVSARASGDVADEAGISLYLVPKDAAGLTIQAYPLLAGGRAAEVTLDGVEGELLTEDGFAVLSDVMALATMAQCAETLGAMDTATRLTNDYLGTRKQFGRPIGTFQALAHRMADMLIEMEQARSAVINAAGNLNEETRIRDMNISAAKNLLGRAGRLIAEESIQMHGGIAMTQEYELAHIAKRIIMADHRFGDTDHHLERYIALSAA
tara:strand:- start:116995 stop:118092 length:1098 start_codon:yes stop_codon:yes gene_type:complete